MKTEKSEASEKVKQSNEESIKKTKTFEEKSGNNQLANSDYEARSDEFEEIRDSEID